MVCELFKLGVENVVKISIVIFGFRDNSVVVKFVLLLGFWICDKKEESICVVCEILKLGSKLVGIIFFGGFLFVGG